MLFFPVYLFIICRNVVFDYVNVIVPKPSAMSQFAAETQIQIYILTGIVTSMYCIGIGKYGFILLGGWGAKWFHQWA